MITRKINRVVALFFMFLTRTTTTRGFTSSIRRRSSSSSYSSSLHMVPWIANNAKRIFWVRHGEVINPGGPDRSVYYGALDVPLSKLGELEAQAAGDYLQQYALRRVFASPLQRAIYGGEQVWKRQSLQDSGVIQLEGFKELDRGAWCGLTKEEIGPENLARFDAGDENVTPDGGESYAALKQRVLEARDKALSLLEMEEAACVVSHLQVTRCVLSDALGIPTHEMAQIKVATASITCIDYTYNEDGMMTQVVHFQSFKPEAGLAQSKDGAN